MLQRTPYNSVIAVSYIGFHIQGISPLLTHNPESMGDTKPGAKKGSRIPEPEVEVERGLYRLEDGSCCLKGIAPRTAILSAASAFKVKRFVTMKSILAHISVTEELIPLINSETGERYQNFSEIDRRRVIVQKSGIIRARPKFNNWSLYFTVAYDPTLLQEVGVQVLPDIVNDAGNRFGIGDYRPDCGGWFGRFKLVDYATSSRLEDFKDFYPA
jgi:hypothetical protein